MRPRPRLVVDNTRPLSPPPPPPARRSAASMERVVKLALCKWSDPSIPLAEKEALIRAYLEGDRD